RVREMLNSQGEWEPVPNWVAKPLREIVAPADPGARTFLSAASSERPPILIVSRAASDSDVAESEQHKSGPPCGLDRNVRAPDPAATSRAMPPEMVPVLSLPRALEKTGP